VNDYVAFRNCVNYELNCINGERNSVLYNGNDHALKLPPQEKVVVKFSSTMKPSQIENNFAEKLEIFEVNINEIKNFEPKLNTNEINHEYSQCKIKENNSESGTIQSKSCNISKDTETTLLDDTKLTS
jgi:hypothetical protein